MSMNKLKSRYKHEKFRTCSVLRAYASLYFECLSLKKYINYFKLGVNEHVITHFHDFYDISFFHDFSRPGNYHFKIP